jgi:2-polyprenyl-6-methoxyphenol hydroxylase-like FAD-dependent oxidoreductase
VTSADADVLVVGAGTTGLSLALQAHAHGARVRIVDQRTEAFRPSRAMIMHPRTLEVLRPLGVTDDLLARGDASPAVRLHLGAREVPVRLADLALADTAFPHLLLIRQADVESVLRRALADAGVAVELATRLVDVRSGVGGPIALLERPDGAVEVRSRYIAGCDGPSSRVRRHAGVAWRGGPYGQEIVLADLELDGLFDACAGHVVVGRHGLLFLFAGGEHATWRLLATRRARADGAPYSQVGAAVPDSEIQALLGAAGLSAAATEIAWSARVRVQHRLAARYRSGRLFLAGDAAHVHSPAGAQGMNLGIQDGANLGWKLAVAARSQPQRVVAGPLLESYESERRPAARQVLALTHALFWGEAGTDPVASAVRSALTPLAAPVVPVVMRRRRLVAEAVRTLSGLRVRYRHSGLSVDAAPSSRNLPTPGDRMPDSEVTCAGRRTRLHRLTAEPGLHVLLQRDAALPGHSASGTLVHLHRISSWPGAGAVALRPDGYVGFRSGVVDAELDRWIERVWA